MIFISIILLDGKRKCLSLSDHSIAFKTIYHRKFYFFVKERTLDMSGTSDFWSRSRREKNFGPGPGPGEKKILVPVPVPVPAKKFWSR